MNWHCHLRIRCSEAVMFRVKRSTVFLAIATLFMITGGILAISVPFNQSPESNVTYTPPEDLCDRVELGGLDVVLNSDFSQWELEESLSKVETEDYGYSRARCSARSEASDTRENKLEIVVNYFKADAGITNWEPTGGRTASIGEAFVYGTQPGPQGYLTSIGFLKEANMDVQVSCICSVSIDSEKYDNDLSKAFFGIAEQIVELSASTED